MIRLGDATVLALTKLRTRRIRTSITIIVSGLLFGGLIAALIVAQGALNSINAFNKEGLGSRYIVQTQTVPAEFQAFSDPSVMARAQQIYTQTIAAKKAAAKTLGISYDPTTEQSPVQSLVAGKNQILDPSAPAAQQALADYSQAHPTPGLPALKQQAASYHPLAFYTATTVPYGILTTMVNGVENFSVSQNSNASPSPQDVFAQTPPQVISASLTQPFLLTSARNTTDPNAIPLVVPYATATQLLNLPDLPKNASASQKLARIKELYTTAGNVYFAACYRNSVSESQIQNAISVASDIAKNAGNKAYQKPDLIYGLPPANSCGQAPVLSDTRSQDEKTLDAKQDQFNAMFGAMVTPDQQKINFHIVGLVPDQQNGPSNTAAGILQNLVGSSLSGDIAIPNDMFQKLPNYTRYEAIFSQSSTAFGLVNQPISYFVEFHTAQDARNFINQKSCSPKSDGSCPAAQPFPLSAFGSNSLAVQDLQQKFSRIFKLATLAVIVIAIIIMTGTVGRMIADSRRETAVFRAIGAKRLDIAEIYSVYTVLLSLLVALFALILGGGIAYGLNYHFWQTATVQAQLAFGGIDTALQFHVFAMSAKIWLVAGAAIASGLVSMLLPLVRNIRRSPIRDMRDET